MVSRRRDRVSCVASPERVHESLARCADGHGTMTALFFSDDPVDIARAKAICARCPIRRRCLDAALERDEPHGVWGGALLEAGAITIKRPTGRPPKRPRPELVTDELGTVIEPAATASSTQPGTTSKRCCSVHA
jgi:WhiB family transcriptional regulator, redox-sensing transcriptional regulator